ncbi:MAG: M1 family peptidase [Gammaproteobacteria bacterium]|nr:M1 family peptidase [Gammaproteobacteria bacterium]
MRILITALIVALATEVSYATDNWPRPFAHDLKVIFAPESHAISVVDTIHLPQESKDKVEIEFYLNAALKLESEFNIQPLDIKHVHGALALRKYKISIPAANKEVTLKYSGQIESLAGSDQEEPAGLISADGVFLAANAGWYPLVEGALVSFKLQASVPSAWTVVSQGRREQVTTADGQQQVTWRESNPQDDIYLIAAPFFEFNKSASDVEAMVFLRQNDESLAKKYLDITAQYIEMYSKLIGPYPYAKFAVVENFWETGYGMPSFTLLGPKVIRMPFILHTSYPHEILHNWWGNGVYVDYRQGNWSEGLTSYLADHLIREQNGNATNYRRDILQGYSDYVSTNKDFPLTAFTARHGSSSEAVGYGKSQMLFHMLRQQLGDDVFIEGLRQLYRRYQFKAASFSDLAQIFSEVSGKQQAEFFRQWTMRSGAPALALSKVIRQRHGTRWRIQGELQQTQKDEAFALQVPVAVTLAGQAQAWQSVIEMKTKIISFALDLPAEPLRLDVDPEFDVFRRVSRAEIPAALSQIFGAEKILVLLPAKASPEMMTAFQSLIDVWRQENSEIQVRRDNEINTLPRDRAVWLLGTENRFATQMHELLSGQGVITQGNSLTMTEGTYDLNDHSIVLTTRAKANSTHAIAWLATRQAAAVPGLARKLPHYGKYSFLVFNGAEPTNIAKGQWPVVESPMAIVFSKKAQAATLRARPSLAR